MNENVNDINHWFMIKVKICMGGDLVESIKWDGIRWHTRCRFDWYFKYRAALLQVKYPRYEVECSWGNDSKPKTAEETLMDKIKGKKAVITKYKNLLKKAEDNWVDLFSIQDDPQYKKAVDKIKRLEFELRILNENIYEKST